MNDTGAEPTEGNGSMELRTPDKIAEPPSGSGDVPVASHPHVDPPPAARKSSVAPATIETPNEATVLSDAEVEASELETTREQLRRQSSEVVRLRALVDAERARYRALFELAPEGYLVTDLSGVIIEGNHGAATMLNIPTDFLRGKPIATYVSESDRREFRIRLYRAKTAAENQDWRLQLQRRGFEPLDVSMSIYPIADEVGHVQQLVISLRDISESRAEIVAGRTPAAVIRAALDALSAEVVLVDSSGRIVTVNHAWAQATSPAGFFPPEIGAGDNYLSLCDAAIANGSSAAEAAREAVWAVVSGKRRTSEAIFALPATDGEPGDSVWYALRAARSDGPEPLYVVVTHENITAQQRALARERALMHERAARTAAEAASQAKSEFLATLSHELRTPLNAIAGYAQLIEMGVRGPVTVQQAEDLRRILRSERHLLGLINELLNFSRLERGDVEVQMQAVPLGPLMTDVLELIEPQASAKELQLTVQRANADVVALADPEKLRQILLNLLSNALKFTRAGGAIAVECDADELHAFVRVRDTGIGIPQSRLADIFDPFVQVHRGLGGSADGVGLGLAISRNLARAMHGELTATSQLGEGSLFELTLLRAAPTADLTPT